MDKVETDKDKTLNSSLSSSRGKSKKEARPSQRKLGHHERAHLERTLPQEQSRATSAATTPADEDRSFTSITVSDGTTTLVRAGAGGAGFLGVGSGGMIALLSAPVTAFGLGLHYERLASRVDTQIVTPFL